MASRVFTPCYIGGWSACEYWGFTEQIFNDIVVISPKRARTKRQTIQNFRYIVRLIPEYKFYGMQKMWRDQMPVWVSDPSKTIVDALDDPALTGGARHMIDVITAYFSSEHRKDEKIAEYLQKQRNGAAYKRLGYIVETLKIDSAMLLDECRNNMGNGYSSLDPALKTRGTHLKRWRLKVNIPPQQTTGV